MHIRGLEQYGLTLDRLYKLGERPISVNVWLKPQCYDPRLFKLSRVQRMKLFEKLKRKNIERTLRAWPNKNVKMKGYKGFPSSFDSEIEANRLAGLAKTKVFDSIEIKNIPGLKKRPRKEPKKLTWYAVRARVAIQVEGQANGYQTVEDRIVIVKAHSTDDAIKRLSAEWKKYAQPSMNLDGYLVRWHMEEIVDVYDMCEDVIDPKGTEVFSSLYKRRMKPEYEWRPFGV